MTTGKKQTRYKRGFPGERENGIIVDKSKINDPLAPIDKVRTIAVRAVAKPNCDQTIQAKKGALYVKAPKASVRKKTISRKPGDGTGGVEFQTKAVKAKAVKTNVRSGDGTHGVNFHK